MLQESTPRLVVWHYAMKTVTCREAGFDCDYVVKGETDDEVMKGGVQHLVRDHDMREEDITFEMKEKVRRLPKTPFS
jgi:predicted small metal-binding protein